MLTPDYLEHVADDAVKLYQKLEDDIIKDISRRIAGAGVMTESARWQIKIAQESGGLYEEILKKVSETNNKSEKVIKRIFEDASIEALKFDDSIYIARGLTPLPINQSKTMLNILINTLRKTKKNLSNLTLTTVSTAQQKFIEICNLAYLEVSSGAFDYNTAIFNAISKLNSGVDVIYPSGKKDKIDVAVRRNILTSVNQTVGKIQEARADEMECDLVEVTAHAGARTTHAKWQGKVFSRSGNSKKYPDFAKSTGYGTAIGLMGINCRHNFFPYFEGDIKSYEKNELEEIKNEKVTYQGKEIPLYEATQLQRQMERKIREDKRELSGLNSILQNGKDDKLIEEAQIKYANKQVQLKQHTSALNKFIKETGLKKDVNRVRISKIAKSTNNVTFKYKDITNKFISNNKEYRVHEQQYYVDADGKKYNVDNKFVVLEPTKREKEVASILGCLYGGEINIIPRVNYPQNIKTPDYIINGMKYDLKSLTENNKNTIYNSVHKQKKQSDNFVIDISGSEMTEDEAIKQIESIYYSKHTKWIKQILLIKDKQILKVYERK